MIERTPLEDWIRSKIVPQSKVLDREQLETYQLNAFKENIAYVKENCLFYNNLLSGVGPYDIRSFKDIESIPFTTAEDIKKQNMQMVCTSQNEINRIVTLDTSGTTDLPKRIYFTDKDQELTTDFFHIGMSTFTKPGEKVLVLLPGIRPGSIGDLLQLALKRMNVEAVVYGIVDDGEKVEHIILNEDINGIVGIPQQVFALSKLKNSSKIKEQGKLKNILLSTDYVSNAVVRKIKENWGCEVYEHYGMTEMGLGGGVFCKALDGYHLREADMLFEIIDPLTGKPVRDGEFGEVVFTTLTRKGMPLIRYRTGDVSRFIAKPCDCGTILKTMDKIQYRIASSATLEDGYVITMSELEERLFSIEGMIDFDASLTLEGNTDCLNIYSRMVSNVEGQKTRIQKALEQSRLGDYILERKLKINIEKQPEKELDIKAIKKRKIIDKRRDEK